MAGAQKIDRLTQVLPPMTNSRTLGLQTEIMWWPAVCFCEICLISPRLTRWRETALEKQRNATDRQSEANNFDP